MAPAYTRPENVLKRAQELIGVDQASAALSLLHEHVSSKRNRNQPIASLEPVMLLFVELCVEQRRGKHAKDGLFQYKNIALNTNVATIGLVFKKFIELAERKVIEAQAKADEAQSTLEARESSVDDLEALETPESILLSTVSGKIPRERTDRAIVTPWLKFLWETYRTVLDILKNNSKLELMYQMTAYQAFQFCSRYERRTEFRRLCDLLRNHLQTAAKFPLTHAINIGDPDTLQRHLDARFLQLNVAVELELWQEAFRSVEDIYNLLNLSKRPAKSSMMLNYFEKLSQIFLVSENHLFRAAAWSRYYNLLRQSVAASNSSGAPYDASAPSDADLSRAANFVVLSALAIPVISTTRSRGALLDVDEARKSKNSRLINLLGMSTSPTRSVLINSAINKGLLNLCRPEIRELYNILEVDFHPISICKKIAPILTQIGAESETEKFVAPLREVILTRLFQQLSQVYESVDLDFVYGLAQFPEPFEISRNDVEKFIMNGCKKGDLAIRIDHAAGVLTFDTDVFSSAKALHSGSSGMTFGRVQHSVQKLQSTPAEIVRSQLRRLASCLHITCQYVDPSFNASLIAAKNEALERSKAGAGQEYSETLARREIIERNKAAVSDALAQREKTLADQKRLRAQEQMAAEAERLAKEQHERNLKRKQAEKAKIQEAEAQKALDELKRGTKGIDLARIDIAGLSFSDIRAIKISALEKEKNDITEKLRSTAKRLDHLERAYRLEEIKYLADDYKKQLEADLELYENMKERTLKNADRKFKEDLQLKERLGRVVPYFEKFRNEIKQQRRAEFERRRREAERELQNMILARKRENKERKARELKEKLEAERRKKEEEEREAQEAEEKARLEAERRRQLEEEKLARIELNRKLDETAAIQRQRELEAEAKVLARKQQNRTAAASHPMVRNVSAQAAPETSRASAAGIGSAPNSGLENSVRTSAPPLPLIPKSRNNGGSGECQIPSWRLREQAKKAGELNSSNTSVNTSSTTTTAAAMANDSSGADNAKSHLHNAATALPRSTAKYTPPHLRRGGSTKLSGRTNVRPGFEDVRDSHDHNNGSGGFNTSEPTNGVHNRNDCSNASDKQQTSSKGIYTSGSS